MIILCTIIGFIFGFVAGINACYVWFDRAKEEACEEYLKAIKENEEKDDADNNN